MAVRLAVYFVAVYLSVGAFFWLMQGTILFPAPKSFEKTTPAISGLRFEDLQIPVNARDHLHAWWIPSAMPSAKVLLVFHGNGYVLEDMAGGEAEGLHEVGANLLLVDYRGYGSSSPIAPNESTVDEDAARASWYLRIYPIGLMLRTHFANASMIGSVRAPVLIIAGTSDTLTPSWMAQEIFARANPARQLYLVPHAGHDDLADVGGNALIQELRKFVQSAR